MTRVQESKKKNEAKVYRNLYGSGEEIQMFVVGDRVQITKKKNIFEKGCTPR